MKPKLKPTGTVQVDSMKPKLKLPGTVQVELIKPKLKPPGTKRLTLKCDILLSNAAFTFNLRRYASAAPLSTGARGRTADSPTGYGGAG